MLQAPYDQVTVVVVIPAAGYAADIFELVDNGNDNGVIRVKNENLLQNDDSEEYVVSKSKLVCYVLGFHLVFFHSKFCYQVTLLYLICRCS